MGLRVAEIHEQTVAKVLRHVALKALHDVMTGRLVGPDDVSQCLGVKLP